MLRTSIKNLLAHKLRLVTTGIAILLGVAFLSGSLVLTDTVQRTFDALFADLNEGVDGYVRGEKVLENQFGESSRPRVEDDLLAEVTAVDGVAFAEGDVLGYAQIVGSDGEAIGNAGGAPTFGGQWSTNEQLNPFDLAEGRAPESDDEVVIDRGSAKTGDLEVGDTTTVLTNAGAIDVTVVGIATFGGLDSAAGSSFAGFTLDAAQRYVAEEGRFDGIAVVAEEGVSEEALQARLGDIVPDGVEAVTGATLTEEEQSDVEQGLGFFRTFMLVFAGIALFVGMFIIYNTFSIIVAQRIKEMALLRAIGASRRQVLASVLLEALVVGIVASVLGVLAGLGVAAGIKALLDAFGLDIPAGGLVLKSTTVIWALVVGIATTMCSAFFPARKGSKVPPIAAMRDVALERTDASILRIVLSGLLTAAGIGMLLLGLFGDGDNALASVGFGALLTLLGVAALGPVFARPVTRLIGSPLPRFRGVTGNLARENAMRNPKRTSRTAAALMIGVALVSLITIVAASFRASIDETLDAQYTGDFVVQAGGFGSGGLSPAVGEQLKALPELDAVAGLRGVPARFDGSDTMMFGIDAPAMGRMTDIGVVEGSLDDLDETGLAISTDTAEAEGWEIGTRVPVTFVETGDSELEVKVIYEEEQLAGGYFVGIPVVDANVPNPFDWQLYVNVADGVSQDDARAAIASVTDEFATAEVQDREEFKDAQAGQITPIVNMIYALLGLAVIIALLGIANTLALSIVERTREIGLLRAVGMTRGQTRSAIRWESVLIALFGTVGGVVVGSFFGWALMKALEDEGLTAFRIPLGGVLTVTVIAIVAGVLAAVLPARRAARMDVLQAIATE